MMWRARRVGIVDQCRKCGEDYIVAGANQKDCPSCQFKSCPISTEAFVKAKKKIKKRLMEISNVKIYGSSSYQPTELERPYFERKDPLFLERLVLRTVKGDQA